MIKISKQLFLFNINLVNTTLMIRIIKHYEEKAENLMISKCYNFCSKSYMEKHLNPYEKECMNSCLQNLYAFYIETNNGLINK